MSKAMAELELALNELFRLKEGPLLSVMERERNPRWDLLMTSAEKVGLTAEMVHGAIFDGGAGGLSSDPRYPYERVALVIDRAERRLGEGEREYVMGEYESLNGDLERETRIGSEPGVIANIQEALRLLRDVVYPEYFSEPTAG